MFINKMYVCVSEAGRLVADDYNDLNNIDNIALNAGFSVWHRRWCCVAVLVLVAGTACVAGPLALRAPPGAPLHERLRLAERLLHDTPLVDGHNDLPWNIRKFLHNRIKDFR